MPHDPAPDRTYPVHVEHTEVVDASVDELWQLVSNFDNVSRWHPDVVDSRIDSGSGKDGYTVRTIHLRNGTPLREKLLAISNTDHTYTYSVIESPLPLRNHRSTVRFEPLGSSETRVTWTADFEAIGADPDQLAQGIKSGVMTQGIAGLRATVKRR